MSPSVLIVDDDPVFRDLARAMLAAAGFDEIAEAADVAEARAVAGRVRPDAVLLDVHLPDGDGLALARELGAAARVLVTSSDASIGRAPGITFVAKTELPGADLRHYLGTSLGPA
ncbi:MAG: response regulator [Solirubrobacteraceae bacterium]